MKKLLMFVLLSSIHFYSLTTEYASLFDSQKDTEANDISSLQEQCKQIQASIKKFVYKNDEELVKNVIFALCDEYDSRYQSLFSDSDGDSDVDNNQTMKKTIRNFLNSASTDKNGRLDSLYSNLRLICGAILDLDNKKIGSARHNGLTPLQKAQTQLKAEQYYSELLNNTITVFRDHNIESDEGSGCCCTIM